jgi:hypothetical protein
MGVVLRCSNKKERLGALQWETARSACFMLLRLAIP